MRVTQVKQVGRLMNVCLQHNYQHLFAHKDIDGENIVDEEKLKNFGVRLKLLVNKTLSYW
jgi:hypothetical protein